MALATTDRFVKDNIKPWLLDAPEPIMAVWSERRQEIMSIAPAEFILVWRDLHAVWMNQHQRGALSFGSSRETLSKVVYWVTGNNYHPEHLRNILEIGVALEWAIPNTGPSGHTCFLLRPIRYEEIL